MTAYRKELILGIIFVIIAFLHVDFWWWGARDPFLFGILPFSIWWGWIIQLLVLVTFLWWNRWGWPAPPEEYEKPTSAKKEG